MTHEIETLWQAEAQLGEGVIFDPRTGLVLWVDIKGDKLFALDPVSHKKQSWTIAGMPSCIVPHGATGYLLARRDGVYPLQLTSDGAMLGDTRLLTVEPDGLRCNDGAVDPAGRFWIGTMDNSEADADAGAWWILPAGGEPQRFDHGFHVTNGPAFDVERARVYFTDSARQTIFCALWQADAMMPLDKFVFRQFDPQDGYPDGMTIDAEGHLWVAFWDGSCVRRFSTDGALVETVAMPVPRPTRPVFGPGGLYVTSARVGLSDAELAKAPLSGSLFRIAMDEALAPPVWAAGA